MERKFYCKLPDITYILVSMHGNDPRTKTQSRRTESAALVRNAAQGIQVSVHGDTIKHFLDVAPNRLQRSFVFWERKAVRLQILGIAGINADMKCRRVPEALKLRPPKTGITTPENKTYLHLPRCIQQ
jgi:hypothetical protein